MTALADQSDVTNEAQVWAIIAGVAALVWVVWIVLALGHARRQKRWEDEKPRPPYRPCNTTGCRYPAVAMVVRRLGAGRVEVLDVCQGCSDEGTAHGWWFPLPVDGPVPFWPAERVS